MEAYLDNSATTCVYQETADLVCDLMVNHYGNPSAMHQKGVEAEQYIRTAQETLAKILKVKEKEIFFPIFDKLFVVCVPILAPA
jgi:cysteine desulfurase